MTTNITVTKTGVTQFDFPIKANYITLNFIHLYCTTYNIPLDSTYTADRNYKLINIPAGHYAVQDLKKLMPNDFEFDNKTLKIQLTGKVTGGLSKIIENNYIYLSQLGLYLYINGIDTSKNYFEGKRSNLLAFIPMTDTDFGKIITFEPQNNIIKLNNSNDINCIDLKILDKYGNEYNHWFIAKFTYMWKN